MLSASPPPPLPPRRPIPLRSAARIALLSFALGLLTSLTAAAILALSADPPDKPPTTLRAFIAHGQPWSIAESSRFGTHRALWSLLTFDSMLTPQELQSQHPSGPPTDPTLAINAYRQRYEPLILKREGGRAFTTPAFWGQFAPGSSAPEPGLRGSDYGFGWPFTCLWYQVLGQDQGMRVIGADLRGGLLISGQPATVGDANCRIIPLRPAWPGLLGSTLIYGAAWAFLLVAIPLLLRTHRRGRGLCPACAYDLRATPAGLPCPECGSLALSR